MLATAGTRVGAASIVSTIPIEGQIIFMGIAAYEMYQIGKYYFDNKAQIDSALAERFEEINDNLKNMANIFEQGLSSGGSPQGPKKDWLQQIIDKVKETFNNLVDDSGAMTEAKRAAEEAVRKELYTHLTRLLNLQGARFDINFVDDIPLDRNGKLPIVVSKLSPASIETTVFNRTQTS
jgi:hypothetical protein